MAHKKLDFIPSPQNLSGINATTNENYERPPAADADITDSSFESDRHRDEGDGASSSSAYYLAAAAPPSTDLDVYGGRVRYHGHLASFTPPTPISTGQAGPVESSNGVRMESQRDFNTRYSNNNSKDALLHHLAPESNDLRDKSSRRALTSPDWAPVKPPTTCRRHHDPKRTTDEDELPTNGISPSPVMIFTI